MTRRSARERTVITTSSPTRPRSPLSNMPFAKINDRVTPAALPTRWANDMQPYVPKEKDRKVLEPLSFLDELEEEIKQSGGIENVMVLPDEMDVNELIANEMRRRTATQNREYLRRTFGLDV